MITGGPRMISSSFIGYPSTETETSLDCWSSSPVSSASTESRLISKVWTQLGQTIPTDSTISHPLGLTKDPN
jgi:hypothetical protein